MLEPIANETQTKFAVRFHEAMIGEIPETESRDRAMMEAWNTAKGVNPLYHAAVRRFGRDHEYHPDCSTAFVEHTTTNKEGDVIIYDRNALVSILDRNNSRIADTGDFSPITEGHTPNKDALDRGAEMPAVLGYAGPFRLGMIGNENPRWAIFADEWHDKADVEKLRKRRRRSPEVWLEERMEDRFMDPIAALGAETPRLDMGMSWYTRGGDGAEVMKYSAASFPSSTNTFVPGEKYDSLSGEDDPQTNPSGDSLMVSTEDIQQIVDALMQTEPMKWVTAQMETDAPQHVAGEEPLPVADPAPEPVAAVPAPEPAPEPEPKVEPAAKRYNCDDEDKDMMHKYMSDECSEEDYQSYMAGKRQKYMSDDDPDDQLTNVDPYQKSNREDQRQMKSHYAKLQTDLVDARDRLQKIETEKATTERYSKLQTKRLEYVFEMDKEVERCSADKMTDAQFEDHLDVMVENYQRIPISGSVPALYAPDHALQTSKEGDAERYAKDAVKYCTAERDKGNNISFADAFDHVQKETA